jgi:hypothetical protein
LIKIISKNLNIKKKLLDFFGDIKYSEAISTIIGLLFTYCYIIYPVWLFPGSVIFDFLTFIILWVLNISIIFYISYTLKKFEEEIKSIISHVKNYLKISAKILSVLFIVLIVIFSEEIFYAPLESRGDESAHIGRIEAYNLLWTVDNRIPGQISLLGIILLLSLLTVIFLHISKIPRKRQLGESIKFIIKSKIFFVLLFPILIIFVFLILVKEFAPILFDRYLLTAFGRFGPLHPSIYAIPLLIFGWSNILIPTWRLMNLITSLGTLFLASYLVNLISEYAHKKESSKQIISSKRIYLNYLFVLPIFFLPAIIRFTFSVWLTTGVVFFNILSSVFTLKYLMETSKGKKRVLLILNSIIFGYGILWKEVLLLQPIIMASFITIKYIFHYFKTPSKKIIKKYGNTILHLGVMMGVIGIPYFFLVQFYNLSWRTYQPEISNIFSINFFDYFNRRYIELGFMADFFYLFLFLLIVFAIIKKQYYLLYLPFAFLTWYIFFTLDSGWSHTVDRFMNIPVLILSLSIAIIVSNLGFFVENLHLKKFNDNRKRNFAVISLILLILIPTSISGNYYLVESLKKTRLPYNSAVVYINTNWDNDSEKIYYDYGPNSFHFYSNIEGFPLGLYVVPKISINTTTDEFLNYCFEENIRFIVMPDSGHLYLGYFPVPVFNDLVLLGLNNSIEMVKFSYYESTYYVWDLRYTNFV